MPVKRPPTAVEALLYGKMSVEQLLAQCYGRIPGFAVNLFCFPAPTAQVMVQWRYDINAPLWAWSRTRSEEAALGGVYNSVREALVTILNRVDRFDTWTWDQAQLKAKREAALRAARAAAAAPTEKPEKDIDEGDEPAVPAEPLPEVTPLPEDPLAGLGAPADDTRAD